MSRNIKLQFSLFFQILGESICAIIIYLFTNIFKLGGMCLVLIWKNTSNIRNKILGILKYIAIFIISPFVKIANNFSRMKNDIKLAKKQKGILAGIIAFIPHFGALFLGKHGIAVTVFNLAAPIISIIFLVNIITYTTSINYAVKLDINGQFFGYIENEQVFFDAEMIVEQRLNNLGSSTQFEVMPQFLLEKIGYSDFLTSYQIADMLLKDSGISVAYAYGIFINGSLRGAVVDNTRIKKTLENLLDVYRTDNPDEEVRFVYNIDCDQTGFYTTDSIIDPQIIINDITQTKQEAQYYEVVWGDNQSLIGDILNMKQAEIEALNPGFIEGDLHVGDKIMYSAEVPSLPVSITRTEIYEQTIPYQTIYNDTESLFEGVSNVVQPGESGVKTVTARVSAINGIESSRVVINERLTREATDEIISRGTKLLPRNTVSTESASYGKFIWPIKRSDGYISQYTGQDGGYSGHSGLDFAAPYGTPIYAGANGTVVYAGSNSGYGKHIILQHENGLRTYYAHCSSLEVSYGEQVTQGQCIALVGQTGIADGNHVHFEVRQGNSILNPINFIDR